MKSLKYIFMAAAVSLAMTSCMDGDDGLFNNDWKEIENTDAPYGNNSITEDNVVTLSQLMSTQTYADAISNNKYAEITDDIKLKVRVIGNDLEGNIYKQVYVQDETNAIIIGINKAGLAGYMAEGQEMLIDLKGLFIGGYGGSPQIGAPYNGGIGRMAESVWMNHFKLIGSPDASQIKPIEFTDANKNDNMKNRLVVLKNVTFKTANGTETLISGAAANGNYYHKELDQFGKDVVVRTSSYADFAATILPYDKEKGAKVPCNIIGIASKYNSTWQIMIRKASDITFDDVETADPTTPDTPSADDAQGDGTLENPFNAAAAIAAASALESKATSTEDYYIKGKISEVRYTFDTSHGTATFYISDDGTTTNQFYIYSVLYLGNRKWTDGDTQIAVGDDVIIYGKLTNWNGTPETASGKACIYSLNGKTAAQ